MSNELIKISTNDKGESLVSARELHEFLGVNSVFTTWFKRMCEYGFENNVDYTEIWSDSKNGNAVEYLGSPQKMSAKGYEVNYIMKIDMAKELSMIQRTEKGKEARKYFIECEKQLKEGKLGSYMIEDPIERAKRWIEEQQEKLELQGKVEEQQEEIKKQQDEISHKKDVIVGLVEDISLAEKRQRITQIIRKGHTNYQLRYNILYNEFEKKYHVDITKRLNNAKSRGEVKKSMNKMGYICEVMNMTSELYELCCKLFENDFNALIEEFKNGVA